MTARYALRMEAEDGTLEDAYHFTAKKADAIRFARAHAKTCSCPDVTRIHVDDTRTDLGVASFEVPR